MSGCVEWPGARTSAGYGVKRFAGKNYYMHRVVLEAKLGRPLEDGELSRHKCDNPPCFNPDHLESGSARDNITDMMNRGRHNPISWSGKKHQLSGAKLWPSDVESIKVALANGVRGRRLAKIWGVTESCISSIKRGRSWA